VTSIGPSLLSCYACDQFVEDMEDSARVQPPAKRQKTESDGLPAVTNSHNAEKASATDTTRSNILEKELSVGITSFVNPSKVRVRGQLKKRYTDFLVNEIQLDGRVLHLLRTGTGKGVEEASEEGGALVDESPSREPGQALEPKSDVSKQENVAVNGRGQSAEEVSISTEDKEKLLSNLNKDAVERLLLLYQAIQLDTKKKPKEHPTVRTEFTSDRTLRAHIHQHIRRIFNSKIESSTTHDGILVLQASASNSQSRQAKPKPNNLSWHERGGDHCHFTLYKENKDTMEVINLLARFLKMNPKELSFGGTKDRRAVTVQRLSARRVDAERLVALNRALRGAVVGDFEYSSGEIALGDLNGNEFTITLRDCDIEGAENSSITEKCDKIQHILTQRMSNLSTHGFINYFGLQRFGTFSTRSDTIGLKLLNGDFEGACNSILEYPDSALVDLNPAEDEETTNNHVGREDRARAQAIQHFRSTNRVNESLNLMPRRFSAESALIRHLGKNANDHVGAILSIQHSMRTLYLHSYQSMVWNQAATNRWTVHCSRVVEGDLVLMKEHPAHEPPASPSQQEGGMDADANGEPIIHPHGPNRAKLANEVFDRARPVTKSEAESGRFSIFDIVLPQPGFDVEYPRNESGAFYKVFMGSEEGGGLDPSEMRRKNREFSLSGAYRKVVARIEGGEGNKEGVGHGKGGKEEGKGWSVEVRRYERDDEQFVKTDFEKIKEAKSLYSGSHAKSPAESEKDEDRHAQEREKQRDIPAEKNDAVNEGSKIAAILKLRLGTGQYATMALRELSAGGVVEYKPEFSGGR
jgi:tRNA pseudouridine13 synthase